MPSDRYRDSHCKDEVVVGPPYNSSLFSILHHVPSYATSYAGTSASRILVEGVFQGPYFRKHFEGYQTKAPIYAGIWSLASSKVLCRYHNPDELSHQKVVPIYIYSLTNIRFVIITLERSNGRLVFILESKTAQNGLHVAWVIKRTSPNRCSVQKRDILLTHWGQVAQIFVSKITIISSDDGLSLEYCKLDPWEQTSMKSQLKFIHFIHENAFEIVLRKLVVASMC